MKNLCDNTLTELVNRISLKYFEKPFIHRATYNRRLRTTGGRYLLDTHMIEVNPKYVLEMNKEDYIGIIKHELCHYHLHIEGKGYRHGDSDFKKLLKKVGAPRHCKPLPSQQVRKKYTYLCLNCEVIYDRLRRVNTSKYCCGKCGGSIQRIR